MARTSDLQRQAREAALQAAFNALVTAALEGRVCPSADTAPLFYGALTALARRGLILIEQTRGNTGHFKRVTILAGEHAGAKTARDPRALNPYRVIGTDLRTHGIAIKWGEARPKPTHPNLILKRRLEARAS